MLISATADIEGWKAALLEATVQRSPSRVAIP